MTLGIEREGLAEPLRALVAAGTPVLGTCAGMIMLDRDHLGVLDISTRRNAFGRQLRSFEADLELEGVEGGPVHAVFIRAPWVQDAAPGVEVLAEGRRASGRDPAGQRARGRVPPRAGRETRLHELLLRSTASCGRTRSRPARARGEYSRNSRSNAAQSNAGSPSGSGGGCSSTGSSPSRRVLGIAAAGEPGGRARRRRSRPRRPSRPAPRGAPAMPPPPTRVEPDRGEHQPPQIGSGDRSRRGAARRRWRRSQPPARPRAPASTPLKAARPWLAHDDRPIARQKSSLRDDPEMLRRPGRAASCSRVTARGSTNWQQVVGAPGLASRCPTGDCRRTAGDRPSRR